MCQLYKKYDVMICTNRVIVMNGVLEIKKNPIIDKGYIKPIISSIDVEVCRVPDNTYRFINI